MGKLSKLFGKKADSDQEAEKPVPKPEDITLMMSSSELNEIVTTPKAAFGLQFHFESGEIRTIDQLPILIGRGENNQLVLNDDTVSPNHARIYFDERVGAVCIEDQDSLNGLFVNNFPTLKNILQDGDKLKAGNIVLTFRDMGYINQG